MMIKKKKKNCADKTKIYAQRIFYFLLEEMTCCMDSRFCFRLFPLNGELSNFITSLYKIPLKSKPQQSSY